MINLEAIKDARWYGAFQMYSGFLEYRSSIICESKETQDILDKVHNYLHEILKEFENT